MSDSREVAVAVLGTGAIAQIVHLPTLTQMKGVSTAAVCDPDLKKAQSLANRFGISAAYADDEELLSDDRIEAVVIAAPSHLHEEHAIAALQAGKHVLMEKPLALTPKGAERVIKAAQKADRVLMVALNNRYRPDVLALKPFASGGELGDVFYVRAGLLNRKVRVARPTWRHKKATAGGGALMDLGLQTLDLALWMLDYPPIQRVTCHLHPAEGMEVEDSAALTVKCETGPVIALQVTWSLFDQRDRQYLEMLGTKGSASLAPMAVYKEVEQGLLDVTPSLPASKSHAYTASYRQMLTHFLDACRGEAEWELPREQVELMRLIGLAYDSAEKRKEVKV